MNFSRIFCCVLIFKIVATQFMAKTDNDYQIVAKFVGELVRDASKKDPPKNYDTLVVQVEGKPQSEFFDEILMQLRFENVLLTFSNQKSIEKVLQGAPMIVIITDGVSLTSFF